jgi:aspartate/methionine/tyrosine aminotransferase
MKPANKLFSSVPTTVFSVFSALASQHGAINLGQGFPDTDGPLWIREAAAQALIDGPNQYPPMQGIDELKIAVADINKKFYGLDVDPHSNILITSGATEALMNCCLSLLNPGDEAIVIEPFYDSYAPQIEAAGGVVKYVRLFPPKWEINEQTFKGAFTEKTKLLILNSPMNPSAKVFSRSELEIIARLAEEFDCYVICDEVYEHIIFDDAQHIPLMSLNGMKDRCLRIGSAGKTFSLTGWKVGYITASNDLIKLVSKAHQFVTFTTPPALQYAIAKGLSSDQAYFKQLQEEMDQGRKSLSQGLSRIGFEVLPCEGSYFLCADISNFNYSGDDYEFCSWLTEKAKVTAIPMSAFYSSKNSPPPTNLIRFCFAKKPQIIQAAIDNLTDFFSSQKKSVKM